MNLRSQRANSIEDIMKDNKLISASTEFAEYIINLDDRLRTRGRAIAIINQLLRSGTSIGANIYEANYAASKADFINKLQIALKECYETEYWLGIFKRTNVITDDEYNFMHTKCSVIRSLLTASIKTAKDNTVLSTIER